MTKNSVDIWLSVNKNGFINISIDKPEKNIDIGKWIYQKPFVSFTIYQELKKLVEHSRLNWESEPEFLSIQLE